MTNFDRLNRATSEASHKATSYTANYTSSYNTPSRDFNKFNNETFNAHNGQCNNYYTNYRH